MERITRQDLITPLGKAADDLGLPAKKEPQPAKGHRCACGAEIIPTTHARDPWRMHADCACGLVTVLTWRGDHWERHTWYLGVDLGAM